MTANNPLTIERSVVNYTCPPGIIFHGENSTWTNRTYNQAATLLFTTGERAIDHLFSRQTHLQFDEPSLLTVLLIYLPLACWCAGSAVSSGLVVPMFFIGGLYGRTLGRIMVRVLGVHTLHYWGWVDPGAFALIGAASFFGGVSRLTMSLTVIMMEITNDVQYLLPIMLAVMTSKWSGDLITHPIYHSLLELKCIPYLANDVAIFKARHTSPSTNEGKQVSTNQQQRQASSTSLNLDLFTVSEVMHSPVDCLLPRETLRQLASLLSMTRHSGFPVVESVTCRRFLGTVSRVELTAILQAVVLGSQPPTYEDLALGRTLRHPSMLLERTSTMSEEELDELVDLVPYINQSALRVPLGFSLQRAFILVRSMGLRHLVVVDTHNSVRGIITRKDLMGFAVEESLDRALREEAAAASSEHTKTTSSADS